MIKENKRGVNHEECLHEYIVCLGKNPETKENYNYCLICGSKVEGPFFGAFCVDATLYLEEYSLETELGRNQKLMALRKQLAELMLENEAPSPAFVIDEFRDTVEFKRNQLYQVRGKVC